MDEGIYYVVQRYNDLFDLLKAWGYEPFPDPECAHRHQPPRRRG